MKVTQRIRILAERRAIAVWIVFLVIWGLLLDRERWIGGIAWTLITAYGMYNFGLWLAGPHLLPIEPDRESKAFARHLLRRFVGGRKLLMAVVREGKVLPGPGGKSRDDARGEGAILIDSTSVVALVTDTGLSRIQGPGIHFTRAGERIGKVIDLRPQSRSSKVEAQTRDGIWVKFDVKTRFQIDGVQSRIVQKVDRRKEKWPAPYTWNKRTPRMIECALGLERAGQDQIVAWDDIVLDEAIKRVRTHVAGYPFDGLTGYPLGELTRYPFGGLTAPYDPSLNPRADISERLEREVKEALAGSGIKVLSVKLGQFAPRDEEIDIQRFESWQAEWLRRINITRAIGYAQSHRMVGFAHALAERQAIGYIINALEESEQAGANNADLIALHFLEVLERLAKDPETQKALGDVRQKLLGGGTPGGVSPSS